MPGGVWRPDIRPRLNEWVADFVLAGQKALDEPDWASRMALFRLYYLGLAPYENARHFVGLSEHSWVQWTEQIRPATGKICCNGKCSSREDASGMIRDRVQLLPD